MLFVYCHHNSHIYFIDWINYESIHTMFPWITYNNTFGKCARPSSIMAYIVWRIYRKSFSTAAKLSIESRKFILKHCSIRIAYISHLSIMARKAFHPAKMSIFFILIASSFSLLTPSLSLRKSLSSVSLPFIVQRVVNFVEQTKNPKHRRFRFRAHVPILTTVCVCSLICQLNKEWRQVGGCGWVGVCYLLRMWIMFSFTENLALKDNII